MPTTVEALRPRMGEIHDRKTRLYGDLVEGGSLGLRPGVGRLIAEARAAGRASSRWPAPRADPTSTPCCGSTSRAGDVPFDVIACGDEARAQEAGARTCSTLALRAPRRRGRPRPIAFEDSAAGIRSALRCRACRSSPRAAATPRATASTGRSRPSPISASPAQPHRHLSGVRLAGRRRHARRPCEAGTRGSAGAVSRPGRRALASSVRVALGAGRNSIAPATRPSAWPSSLARRRRPGPPVPSSTRRETEPAGRAGTLRRLAFAIAVHARRCVAALPLRAQAAYNPRHPHRAGVEEGSRQWPRPSAAIRVSKVTPWPAIPSSRTSCTARAASTRSARSCSASSPARSPWRPSSACRTRR